MQKVKKKKPTFDFKKFMADYQIKGWDISHRTEKLGACTSVGIVLNQDSTYRIKSLINKLGANALRTLRGNLRKEFVWAVKLLDPKVKRVVVSKKDGCIRWKY